MYTPSPDDLKKWLNALLGVTFGLCSFAQIKFTMVVNIYIINKKLFRLQLWKMEVHKTWFN